MAMEMRNSEVYETSDIALAAFLYCSATHLSEINRTNPQRCVFVFTSPKLELISKWQEGRAIVNALAYFNAYQTLKAKLFRDGGLW